MQVITTWTKLLTTKDNIFIMTFSAEIFNLLVKTTNDTILLKEERERFLNYQNKVQTHPFTAATKRSQV